MMGRPPLPWAVRSVFWDGISRGWSIKASARAAGCSPAAGRKWMKQAGGVKPRLVKHRPGMLSFIDRVRIAELEEARYSAAAIGRVLGRPTSTITRELARGCDRRGGYDPVRAQDAVDAAMRRPKARRFELNQRLHVEVQKRLDLRNSPEQISGRLRVDFPDEPEMWVSPETIYQALYVQGRGALKREVAATLRTGRVHRKPRTAATRKPGAVKDMINISERPAEARDRAVPGHWEGDLIMGANNASAVGTLVERSTGFVMLLHLPDDHTAATVAAAMQAAVPKIPEVLRRSLTWDQGSEMALHTQITQATGLPIYFCDPHSPWQRGSNENTNGLLRQYLPKGSDLSIHGPGILDNIAAELNARPRKRFDWATPAEVLNAFLTKQGRVAPTA
ncbi:IS30 family transposase [Janibacter sp. HTCC2649]|uniref:IS30 family transposase n=1 Tax=Janibacter sp. HTCC2649 TaxID=313589 RepID=UPI0003208CB9